MKFSSTTDLTGLIQDCETILGMEDANISGNATLLKVFTRTINVWYRRVNTWIWQSTGNWEYDDSNWTDLPIATTIIVDDQQDYEIPSKAQKIDKIEVLNSDGNYQLLKAIDKSEIKVAMSEYKKTAGMPTEYDLIGRSVFLYPKPSTDSVTATKGLKIYFSRDIDEFISTDTTAEPGFVNSFHRILSLGASYDYAISYEMTTLLPYLKGQIDEIKKELKHFYAHRHRGLRPHFRPKRRNYT